VSYADDLDYFACALSTLIGRDERAHHADRTPPDIALACRDIAVTRLRTMCGLVTGTGPTLDNFLARNITTDPAGALYSALADLPMLGGRDRPVLVEILTARPRPGQKEWQELARASLFLEPYSDALPDLPGPFAWKAVTDIANLATGLPCLDEDLHLHRGLPAVDPGRHGVLRLAAAQLESIRRDVHGDLFMIRPTRHVVRPVRTIADLGTGNADLARLIRRRGADISAPEIRAAARVLVEGLDLVGRIESGLGEGFQAATIGGPAGAAAKQLNWVLLTPLATLNDGAPDPIARQLSAGMSRQFQSLHGLCDRLDARADTPSRAADHARIGAGLEGWLRSVPQVVAALDHALSAAHDQRRLLGRAPDPAPADARRWYPLSGDLTAMPRGVIGAVREAREVIRESWPDSGNRGAPSRRVAPVAAEPARTRRAAEEALGAHPNQRAEGRRAAENAKTPRRFRAGRLPGDQARGSISR
jgi:hypothetical protein